MAKDFDEFWQSLTDEEQDRIKTNLLREPEERVSPTERLRKAFGEQPDSREVREQRRNKGGTDDGE